MATTAIWDVKDRLDRVIDYAANPNKTENIDFASPDFQGLRNVLNYMEQDYKTEKQYYVTGLNCEPAIAAKQMIQTKLQYQKTGGILAYHAYQSFAPGEATPETAHAIGVKLAQELWGDRFEVVVSTHVDKRHLHNHFVLNSVSFTDGKRYYDNHKTYDHMREVSDALCRENSLSVIDHPKTGRSMPYLEWKAERAGNPIWRGLIREDIDKILDSSFTFNQFIAGLKNLGYEVKTNVKYVAVRPQGKERFVRLKSLGEAYTEVAIKERILNGGKEEILYQKSIFYAFQKSSLRGLYYHYLYALGILPKNKDASKCEAPFFMREKLMIEGVMVREYNILATHRIETYDELSAYMQTCNQKIDVLVGQKKSVPDEGDKAKFGAEIKTLRQELKDCEKIAQRSVEMFKEQNDYAEKLKKEEKENQKDDKQRSARSDRQHDA